MNILVKFIDKPLNSIGIIILYVKYKYLNLMCIKKIPMNYKICLFRDIKTGFC